MTQIVAQRRAMKRAVVTIGCALAVLTGLESHGAVPRRLMTAQAVQQRAFSHMRPVTKTLESTHAGTPAWWHAYVTAEAQWAHYVEILQKVGMQGHQLKVFTSGRSGIFKSLDESLRAAYTLSMTDAFARSPAPQRLPGSPANLSRERRVVFSGRSRAGGEVVFVERDVCEGEERLRLHRMRPNAGYGARAELLSQTGVKVEGASRLGEVGSAWRKLRQRDARQDYGRQPFIEQAVGLVEVNDNKARWRGPGRATVIKVGTSPLRKTLKWSKRECCAWAVASVHVDVNSGRVFAALRERCKWNAVEGDPCFDPAQRQVAFTNQHCALSDLHWVRFGRVLEAKDLFARPESTRPLHPKWRRPTLPRLLRR